MELSEALVTNSLVHYQLHGERQFLDQGLIGHDVSDSKENDDRINIVGGEGSGKVELRKTVTNITQEGNESTENTGVSSDILEYRIYFDNFSDSEIKQLTVFDYVPEFSQVEGDIRCDNTNNSFPSTLSCETEPDTIESGYRGRIEWIFEGEIFPGESGMVSYQIKID